MVDSQNSLNEIREAVQRIQQQIQEITRELETIQEKIRELETRSKYAVYAWSVR